ncbi:MAG TPA: hypothetical protein VGM09_23395 [Bradyrhizobium sp.]
MEARSFFICHECSTARARRYVHAHWDAVNVLCKLNGIPFDATGEKIERDGLWCVYEFGQQLDAMMFWDRFQGRWLRGEEFAYPERPENMPSMKDIDRSRPWIKSRPTSDDRVSKMRNIVAEQKRRKNSAPLATVQLSL